MVASSAPLDTQHCVYHLAHTPVRTLAARVLRYSAPRIRRGPRWEEHYSRRHAASAYAAPATTRTLRDLRAQHYHGVSPCLFVRGRVNTPCRSRRALQPLLHLPLPHTAVTRELYPACAGGTAPTTAHMRLFIGASPFDLYDV